MSTRDAVRTASKIAWSVCLLLFATFLYLLAVSQLLAGLLTHSFQDRGEAVLLFLILFGGPATWFAHLGIRRLLDAGRVPRDPGDLDQRDSHSKLSAIGRNLFYVSLAIGTALLVSMIIRTATQANSTNGMDEQGIDVILALLYSGLGMVVLANVGLWMVGVGALFRTRAPSRAASRASGNCD